MNYLFDTNIVSELRRRRPDNASLFSWRDSIGEERSFISVITVLELEFGALRAARKRVPEAEAIRKWLDEGVLVEFANGLLPVDLDVALASARLQTIRTFPGNDSLLPQRRSSMT